MEKGKGQNINEIAFDASRSRVPAEAVWAYRIP
jgi:hypothetical protein